MIHSSTMRAICVRPLTWRRIISSRPKTTPVSYTHLDVYKRQTVAEVGADKQLLYTILPGKGLDTSIYADVQNFEMDAISINGIKLNFNLEIDEEELTAKDVYKRQHLITVLLYHSCGQSVQMLP